MGDLSNFMDLIAYNPAVKQSIGVSLTLRTVAYRSESGGVWWWFRAGMVV